MPMRRSSHDAVDDLRELLTIFAAFGQRNGSRLPIYSDHFLVFIGMHPGGTTMLELREHFGLSPSSASRTCLALEREGLVSLTPDREDRRRTFVSLTPRGSRIIDDVLVAYRGRRR